jgi:hypothetical protein
VQALLSDSASLGVFTTGLMRHAPALRKRLLYTFFWGLVLAVKVRQPTYYAVLCCALFVCVALAHARTNECLFKCSNQRLANNHMMLVNGLCSYTPSTMLCSAVQLLYALKLSHALMHCEQCVLEITSSEVICYTYPVILTTCQ